MHHIRVGKLRSILCNGRYNYSNFSDHESLHMVLSIPVNHVLHNAIVGGFCVEKPLVSLDACNNAER